MNKIDHDDDYEISQILVGRKIISYVDDTLTLDNGTTLYIQPNDGCGGCVSGYYQLDALNTFDNVITKAEVSVADDLTTSQYGSTTTYELFVYAEGVPTGQSVVTVSGDDGNGYYGTGFSIIVTEAGR